MQRKPASKASLYLIDVMPQDQFRPKLVTEEYLRAGDDVEVQRSCLFDLATGDEIFVDNSLFANPYAITSIGWSRSSHGQKYYFIFNERGHQHLRLLEINRNGAVKVLAEEKSNTFVDHHQKTYFKLLLRTNEFLRASERDNWNHIYLYDLTDGKLECQITKGEWNVHSIDHVDVKKRKLWVRVLGIMPDQDPYYAHLVSVNFDGSMLQSRLFAEVGRSRCRNWQEVVSLQKEQQTQIYGTLVYPSNLDETKSYPVVEYIYARPQDSYTPKAFRPSTELRTLANKGFIVVRSDGMGTNWAIKRRFTTFATKTIKDAGFPDRTAWIGARRQNTRPFMNLSRVGCYGLLCRQAKTAAAAAAAVLHHADFYKARRPPARPGPTINPPGRLTTVE